MSALDRNVQMKLSNYYRVFLGDPARLVAHQEGIRLLREDVESLEDCWNAEEEAGISGLDLPRSQAEFLEWYLMFEKKMNADIQYFIDYMRCCASAEEVAYYICMEEMVDGSFDDLMAMVQLGMPINCKMIAGENYWDEMGGGDYSAVHTTMFKTSSAYMRRILNGKDVSIDSPSTECLMNGNILLMWALRREYNIRLVGAMGLVEGSAPVRFGATTAAMERLGLPKEVVAYHKAHISIDTHHSRAWYESLLKHYSSCGGAVLRELALGVSIRYNVAIRYYKYMYGAMRSLS
ncbi:iron-containing redox enzyme family protein [Pseudomonas sp. BP8]|uniref:iron-containing redox enzyme family protein n=1 Tax=Pseudomonas sp. BP8 TaxID=2817864 RepID=UPI001AE36AA3|nr:iron-containing redox enzyme family protein [Pseudomonas sp. BP8]MBP2261655.1 hypothetical protein [Pseudomonas sp. BP8]HDS1737944.1 iron-containing redox enzyme family protein [Pseudomonas putida]